MNGTTTLGTGTVLRNGDLHHIYADRRLLQRDGRLRRRCEQRCFHVLCGCGHGLARSAQLHRLALADERLSRLRQARNHDAYSHLGQRLCHRHHSQLRQLAEDTICSFSESASRLTWEARRLRP